MRPLPTFLPALLLTCVAVPGAARAQDGSAGNGSILRRTRCEIPPYEQVGAGASGIDREGWERIRSGRDGLECSRLAYRSDGLAVVGFVYAPAPEAGRRHPVVIFNRGGNRELGRIGLVELLFMRRLAREGFLVVASQYRGNDGGEGREEFGGADVRDVLALRELLRELPTADCGTVFLVGHSRGAMVTYLALRAGLEAKAAVAWAGPTDLSAWGRSRPELVGAVFRELIPGFAEREEEVLRDRSAVHWAEAIQAPVLILHGTADDRVPVEHAVRMAERLRAAGRPHELVLYPGDDHALSRNREEAVRRIVAWLRRHTAEGGGGAGLNRGRCGPPPASTR